ncbi:ATP-binding protein [Phyllobacterium phragmitis]|uniref:HD-CE domain-containing protein n=1 Tax=Phyllobacterium phragmitis TaxID=2670329 RepID=A0ABQ0GWP0_9HYPH
MSFKQTALWKAAFEDARADATPDEQARLAGCYEAMRTRASALVAKIASDLPHMTVHDVTHLDALWEMASIAAGENFDLNPAEAFVVGGAILLHDAAMTLAAFPGGIAELREQTEWRDLHARHMASVPAGDAAAAKEAENRATADALRLLHAKQAENLPTISWMGPQKQPMFIIEDQQVRNFYGQKIGKVAYSHWWSIARVEEELSGTLGALPDVTNCTVDLLKVACLLRVADAMHLDQRRAPTFDLALVQPTGISADHWKFQERMAKPFVQADALVYTAQPPFEVEAADAWWTAFDALQIVDRELRDVDRVLRERQKKPLVVRRVEGAHSPSDLARTVETVGWTPVDSTVRVSDVPKIVATLGGSKLYGDSIAAPIRELIQNALDAITARRRLQGRPPKWGELHVMLQRRDDGFWLCFEDNGVGMSPTVLTGPLIDFGNSFWKSSLAIQEFPGLAAAGMKSRGKYGIGFFSIFMLGDQVRVLTRRFDRDIQSARVLEFRHGLGSRPNLRHADPNEVPIDGGTRVEVKLKTNPFEPDGLLYRKNIFDKKNVVKLSSVIAAIAPACDVAITVIQDDEAQGNTAAGDWLEISAVTLLNRINGNDDKEPAPTTKPWEQLTELRDEDGKLYGRARIDAANQWSTFGLLTVDGLAASKIGLVAGILLGVETTASRNSASPIIPAPVLASWSSEQAIVIGAAEIPDAEKAQAAAIVMACGGDVAELPVVWWHEEWMTTSQFVSAVKPLDRLEVYEGSISHEDDDDVTKREFESAFKANAQIAQTVDGRFSRNDWIAAVTQGNGSTPLEVIEALLCEAWGQVERDEDTLVVGEANGMEIYRMVAIYSPASEEDEDAD